MDANPKILDGDVGDVHIHYTIFHYCRELQIPAQGPTNGPAYGLAQGPVHDQLQGPENGPAQGLSQWPSQQGPVHDQVQGPENGPAQGLSQRPAHNHLPESNITNIRITVNNKYKAIAWEFYFVYITTRYAFCIFFKLGNSS